ncbi:MAG: phosphocholine cytidylyltransferase family protein [Proteobacteria bacterium]|nr:phosphocholine cytidylyltransferase family protein [Pseudomonadota bacterium]
MKITLDVSKEQQRFLEENPEFDLQGWFGRELDKKIRKTVIKNKKTSAIIIAAGYESRLSNDVSNGPKAMLKIKGKSLLKRQIEILNRYNLNDITIVRGYKKEQINIPDVAYIDNDEYATTDILYSFFLASKKMKGRTILLYSDILFEKEIVERLLSDTSDFAVIVDRSWREHYHERTQHTMDEAELVQVDNDQISHMGRDIPFKSAYGEFIGISMYSEKGVEKVKQLFGNLEDATTENDIPFDLKKEKLTGFYNALISRGEQITPVSILGGWMEIDTFEDFKKSWTMVP